MTYLVKDIRDQLAASTAIANHFADRIYADNAPQRAAYPHIVIGEIANLPEYSLGGEAGTHSSQIQIDVWTDGTGGKERANELGESIRNRLNGYRGQFGTGVSGTARMISNNSAAVPPTDAGDRRRYRVSMDFEIIHTADVPTFA